VCSFCCQAGEKWLKVLKMTDPVTVPDVRVGVGLTGDKASDALLGQSFLSRFDVMMNKDQMVLRPRL